MITLDLEYIFNDKSLNQNNIGQAYNYNAIYS